MKLLKVSFFHANLSGNKLKIKEIGTAWWAGKTVAKYTVSKIFSSPGAWKFNAYLGWLQELSPFFSASTWGGVCNIRRSEPSILFFLKPFLTFPNLNFAQLGKLSLPYARNFCENGFIGHWPSNIACFKELTLWTQNLIKRHYWG